MNQSIAIVGMSCLYPDARTPAELWDNVLAQRRAFRRIPPQRLRAEDYLSEDRSAPDRTYVAEAAVIEGYEFDRVNFRVVGSTYRSADLAHWIALDVATQALADAGFRNGEGLPRETTGVVLGNTLTGEFSRANTLRLRWPYVRRVLDAALAGEDWSPAQRREFLERLEERYKAPFPPVGEETLAGGLSNTIAGRICNQFDLKGGGYTVDGACASSLLAVANACSSLVAADVDVALAGGVDLSLDPFEMVGFAKVGALAPELMRIYDARSAGFWPGEGCGFVVLMRLEEAVAQCRRIYAVIQGWGISSDGSGGITRPEVDGQIQALRRAYRRAGYGIDTVGYFEGHGTGTSVGDATELRVISRARREARPAAAAAVIGSIKANFGHTKAAAGIAGLIKATMALQTQILPPTTGCEKPHAELTGESPALRVLNEPELWPADLPLRASVSAMGFGGINTHLTLEGTATDRRTKLTPRERTLAASVQDAELFLFCGKDAEDLLRQVNRVASFAARLSRAELGDLAAELARSLERSSFRAAVVAASPAELAQRLATLKTWLAEGAVAQLDLNSQVFLSNRAEAPRIGFLFPGQGSPVNFGGGIYGRRFDTVRRLYSDAHLPVSGESVSTEVVQPALVVASLAGLHLLSELGIAAAVAVGHSLGEITALHWAGVFAEATLLRIACVRGKAMAELGSPTGTMAAIFASWDEVHALLNGEPVAIVGFNSPRQTVIAGEAEAVKAVAVRAQQRGLRSANLPVSHAFHTPLVSAAIPVLAAQLEQEEFQPLQRRVVSTVTGARLQAGEDLRKLLCRQVTSPVRFQEAVASAEPEVDLWIEVGPGHVLSGLARECQSKPAVALDAGGASLKDFLQAVGAAYALGAPVNPAALFRGRFTRPFNLDWQPKFFANPCELAPAPIDPPSARSEEATEPSGDTEAHKRGEGSLGSVLVHGAREAPDKAPLELVRELVADRAELPTAAVKDDSRLLSDLHLNSITVGQLVADAARCLGLPPIIGLNEFANATVAKVAEALEELGHSGGAKTAVVEKRVPAGVDAWIRPFTIGWVERPLETRAARPSAQASENNWRVLAAPGHPFAAALHRLLAQAGGAGVVVCLPPEPDLSRVLQQASCLDAEGNQVSLLLQGARAILSQKANARFVLVQHGWNAGGFARSLHLEAPEIPTCVVEVPWGHPQAADWVRDEVLATRGFSETRYDTAGRRWEPRLQLLPLPEPSGELPLGPQDVLLVTGGGKGITAESALALARQTGARLALLGRSQPEADAELSANLERMSAAGVRCKYFVADVTDAVAVQAVVAQAERELGAITAVLHGAGTNVPQALSALDEAAFRRTLAPKIQGLRNVLAAIPSEQLRLLITFGSIIGRAGLHGEADYAVANEWQSLLTERFQAAHPNCRCLAVEWSVWSGLGMGARLGRVESLMQHGVTPITPDQGIALLLRLLGQRLPATAVVVTGRFGDPPTLIMEKPELPFTRFLEQPRLFYPGVELIVDAVLSAETDPYVEDHVFRGERLFPAVLGLEAMAQAAMALTGSPVPPSFEAVQFNRAVTVPKDSAVTIRLAALARQPHEVEVALRSEESGFQVDHFRAVCRFDEKAEGKRQLEKPGSEGAACGAESAAADLKSDIANGKADGPRLEPLRDLYGDLLFHAGRFRRLKDYRLLRAKECLAEISLDAEATWFGRYLPPGLMLGDPGARDAAIHAIQACIPHARLLPIGVDRIKVEQVSCLGSSSAGSASGAGAAGELTATVFVHAQEQSRDGDTFSYNLELIDAAGRVLERWEGLRLRIIEPVAHRGAWVEALLGPYLERRLQELIPGTNVTVVLNRNGAVERTVRSDQAIQRAVGDKVVVLRRPDGKPEIMEQRNGMGLAALQVSASHAGDLTLAVAGAGPMSCDLEAVTARPVSTWQDLLGAERIKLAEMISREAAEDTDTAATRVWVARECLKKAGAAADAPLVLAAVKADGWVLLASGSLTIATCVASVATMPNRLAMGVLAGGKLSEGAAPLPSQLSCSFAS